MKKITSLILALVMALSLTTAAFAADPIKSAETTGTVTITTDSTTDPDAGTVKLGESYTINVPGSLDNSIKPDGSEAANYYVVVSWKVNSDITYQVGGEGYTWTLKGTDDFTGVAVTENVKSAGYVSGGDKWVGSATVELTVQNWSNKALTATSEFKGATDTESYVDTTITAVADKAGNKWTVNSAEVTEIASAAAGILDGTITALYTDTPVTATQTIEIATPTAGAINASGNIGFVTLTISAVA